MFYTLPFIFTLIAIAYIHSSIHIIHAIFASRCIALHRSVELRVLTPKTEPSRAKSRRHLQNKRQNPLERNAEGCHRDKARALSSQELTVSAYPKMKSLRQKLTLSIMGFRQKLTSSVMASSLELTSSVMGFRQKLISSIMGFHQKLTSSVMAFSSEIDLISHGLLSKINFICHGLL
jgi:hypothetical protein